MGYGSDQSSKEETAKWTHLQNGQASKAQGPLWKREQEIV